MFKRRHSLAATIQLSILMNRHSESYRSMFQKYLDEQMPDLSMQLVLENCSSQIIKVNVVHILMSSRHIFAPFGENVDCGPLNDKSNPTRDVVWKLKIREVLMPQTLESFYFPVSDRPVLKSQPREESPLATEFDFNWEAYIPGRTLSPDAMFKGWSRSEIATV